MTYRLAVHADAAESYAAQRGEYLAGLVAPMDDMWAAFADAATAYALSVDGETVGSCCVDDERRLLRFFVRPSSRRHATGLLRAALGELGVARMVVATCDPGYLGPALDLAAGVEVHTLLFGPAVEPDGPGLDDLRVAAPDDHSRIVTFQHEQVGAPRGFLEHYVGERLDRREMLLFEARGELRCVGELRRDAQQAGVAQLGLIVHGELRGTGVGTRMMSSLVRRSRGEGLAPHCSTEVGNIGARRTIERAGLRADHRLLFVRHAG